jgi:hypothetical protein
LSTNTAIWPDKLDFLACRGDQGNFEIEDRVVDKFQAHFAYALPGVCEIVEDSAENAQLYYQ